MEYLKGAMSKFIWDAFCDPDGVGVNIADVLDGAALAGVVLTDDQKEGVIRHMGDVDSWTAGDEAVRDKIADATDNATYEQLFDWLAFVVGDDAAKMMEKEWRE